MINLTTQSRNMALITDIALVVTTFHRRHKYMGFVFETLHKNFDISWEKYIITNKILKNDDYKVIVMDEIKWCILNYKALQKIKKNNPKIKYILFLIEDLVPLKKIDIKLIEKDIELISNNNFKNIMYLTYEHKDNIEIKIDDTYLYEVHPEHNYYSQLQPGIWELNHLISIFELANMQPSCDPWTFEKIKPKQKHYISAYYWPCAFGGFFEYGKVNRKALSMIIRGKFSLKWKLYFTYEWMITLFAYNIKQIYLRLFSINKN